MGNADADLMFVGEAPGAEEDRQGKPFVGRAGKLLDQLLAEIEMDRRSHAFIANVLKCRPPGNRDPQPDEIEACGPYLQRQIQLIEPRVICTLGNFATKLLSGSNVGITRVRGRPQEREIAGVPVLLYPLFHPRRRAAYAGGPPAASRGLRRNPGASRAHRAGGRGSGGPGRAGACGRHRGVAGAWARAARHARLSGRLAGA